MERFLTIPLEAWHKDGLDKLGLPYPVGAMTAFIQWLQLLETRDKKKRLSGLTIDKYAFYVRHYLLYCGVCILFFLHSILK